MYGRVKEQYRLSSDDPVVSMTAISWLGPKFKYMSFHFYAE
jgi:hypothetical protein